MSKTIALALLLVLAAGSCSSQSRPAQPPDVKPASPPKTSPAKPAGGTGTERHGEAVVPAGARFTIFCARVEGDLHVQRADRMKNELITSTGMNDWYVIHEQGQSLLYYGYYRSINDPSDAAETARAQADRHKIDLMSDNMGNRPFKNALFVELIAPDPAAPPEWNLVNAKGRWTLQIAAYRDSPLRKQAAVDAVREARASGIEAYYYHGPAVSSVCIGAWPEQAVRTTEEVVADSAHPKRKMLVAPSGIADADLLAAKRSNFNVVQPKMEITDPTLLAAMRQYPYHAINGIQTSRIINGREVFDPSLPVLIPREQPSALSQPVEPPAVRSPPQPERSGEPGDTGTKPRQPPPQPGVGRLKSLER